MTVFCDEIPLTPEERLGRYWRDRFEWALDVSVSPDRYDDWSKMRAYRVLWFNTPVHAPRWKWRQ